MKVYKENQFLIFNFEDGKTVKYDFATKTSIGKNNKEVKNLSVQLRGYTIDDIFESCEDKRYAKFLQFIQTNESRHGIQITNIGTILNKVPSYEKYEQLFSAGIDSIIIDKDMRKYNIGNIPKGLIKICREHKLKLRSHLIDFYIENPNGYQSAFEFEYTSLTNEDICNILSYYRSGWSQADKKYIALSLYNELIFEYGYTAKGLMNYIDYLITYEAIDNTDYILRELYDYVKMMNKISHKFDKYPKHFLTTHRIATRNYNRLKEKFDEDCFKKRICKEMEKTFGDYCFIYPKSTNEIKDEAVNMHNCVASYIQRVIDGQCHIMFLRKKEELDKSLVTIEVRNGKIVQAFQKFNSPITDEQKNIIDKWNKWYLMKKE